MKRKLLNGVMLFAALAGVGTLSSCKDYDSIELSQQQTNQKFDEKLVALQQQLDLLETAHKDFEEAVGLRFDALKLELDGKFSELENKLAGKVDKSVFDNKMTSIDAAIEDLKKKIAEIKECGCGGQGGDGCTCGITEQKVRDWAKEEAQLLINGIDFDKEIADALANKDSQFYQDLVNIINQTINGAVTDISGLESRLTSLEDKVRDMRNTLIALDNRITALEQKKGITREEAVQIAQQEAEKIVDAKMVAIYTELTTIQTSLTQMQTTLDGQAADINNLTNKITNINAQISVITNNLENFSNRLTQAEKDAVAALTQAADNKAAIDLINTVWVPVIENLETSVGDLKVDMSDVKLSLAEIRTDITDLKLKYDDLNDELVKQINGVYDYVNGELTTLNKNVGDLTVKIDDVDGKVDNISGQLSNLTEDMDKLKTGVDEINGSILGLNQEIADIKDALTGLASTSALEALTKRVAANEDAIKLLQEDVNRLLGLEDRLNSLITGVQVQGVFNPVFGSFSLPIGVQSNLLVNYFGRYDGVSDLTFPSTSSTRSHNGTPMLTDEEYQAILDAGFSEANAFTVHNGDYLTDGKLGKIFLTINPNNINFTGGLLSLEKSNGEAAKIKVENVTRSSEVLTFGTSRAENGFYQADVVFNKAAMGSSISSIKLEVVDGLGTAVKDAIKNHTKSDVFAMMKKVYDQLTINLPAYGLKAGWSVGGKDYATFSKYEIAAVTFTPLSYTTLENETIDKGLPTHSPLNDVLLDINKNSYHFNLDIKIKVDTSNINPEFNLKDVEFDYDEMADRLYLDISGKTLHTTDGDITFGPNSYLYLDEAGVKNFMSEIEKQLNTKALPEWDNQLKTEFHKALNDLADQVNAAVEKGMADLNKQINDKIDDIIDDIQGKVNDKAGKVIRKFNDLLEKYNQFAERINNWIQRPNHLMQPTILYTAGDSQLHDLSNHIKHPSTFSKGSGDGIELFATSYNFEIFTPAYKKFIAVVGAYDANRNPVTLTKAELKDLNAGGSLLKVVDGSTKRFALSVAKMKPGLTYEIIYSALDYHGYTSTQHFYLTIKK